MRQPLSQEYLGLGKIRSRNAGQGEELPAQRLHGVGMQQHGPALRGHDRIHHEIGKGKLLYCPRHSLHQVGGGEHSCLGGTHPDVGDHCPDLRRDEFHGEFVDGCHFPGVLDREGGER